MATLQEMQRELADKRAAQLERLKAAKAVPAHEREGLLNEINGAETEMKSLHDKVVQEQTLDEMEKRHNAETKAFNEPNNTVPFSTQDPYADGRKGRGAVKSLGEQLIERDELKAFKDTPGKKSISLDFGVKSVQEWKATLTTAAGGVLTGYDRVPGIVQVGTQVPHIADLLAQGETDQPTIRYIRENSYTNAAGMVDEGGQKPEATFDLVEQDAPVRKIAVIARVSDEMFSDFPAVRDYVNQRLPFMVEQAEDSALLNGDGNAPNLRGILNTSGILSGGTLNQGVSADPIADVVYRAVTQIRAVSFFEPDGVVFNALDWQGVRLMKSGDGVNAALFYVWGNPSMPGPNTIWGLPVITTQMIAQKTVLTGAFKLGAQIFRRQGITLDMTNSDGNDFQFNRMAIRCELREALCVYRPASFAKSVLQ